MKELPTTQAPLAGGRDRRLQDRKLAAWISFILGSALLVQGASLPPGADLQSKVGPALVALCFSLLFWGLVTIQNVFQLIALLRGQGARSDDRAPQASKGGSE